MTYISAELGITTDELFSPGSVRFCCAKWGLPDNTARKAGLHIVYRPLCRGMGYLGHEYVTDAMCEAVRLHYAAERAMEAAAGDARREAGEREHEAMMARRASPAWAAAQEVRARKGREYDAIQNEGYGDGYNPYREG